MRHLSPPLTFAALGLCAGIAVGQGLTAVGHPVSLEEVVRGHPIDARTGAALTTVAAGEFATVNVFQVAGGIPAHFHRAHEEIVIAQSGTAEMRVGDRTFALKAGDVLLVPKGVIHSVRATGSRPFRGFSVFGPAFDGQDRVFVEKKP